MIAPTLLVGLGGTGSKIVCRVSQMVTEEQRKIILSGSSQADFRCDKNTSQRSDNCRLSLSILQKEHASKKPPVPQAGSATVSVIFGSAFFE